MNQKFTVSALALCVALAASSAAFAQSQINTSKEAQRDITQTDVSTPNGYMAGRFLIKPSVTVSEEYNDNIYTEERNEIGDFITHIAPKISAELQNSMHQLKLNAGLDQALFADETQNHYLNYNAGVSDKVVLDKTMYWAGNLGYRKSHSLPGDDDANPGADAGEPLPYNIYDANMRISKDFGMLSAMPRVGFRRYEYQNVRRVNNVMLDQGYRDRDELSVGGRIGYDIDSAYQLFTDLDYKTENYLASSTTDRDSDGGNYVAGVRYAPSKAFSVEAGLGYLNREYDTAAYDDINTLGATVSVSWLPMPDVKLLLDYDRSIIEVTDTGVGGAVRDDVSAQLTKDFTPELSGKIKLRYANTDFEGGNGATSGTEDRQDKYFSAGAGVSYHITENVAFTADYTYGNNNSNRNTSDYNQNVVLLGIKAGF